MNLQDYAKVCAGNPALSLQYVLRILQILQQLSSCYASLSFSLICSAAELSHDFSGALLSSRFCICCLPSISKVWIFSLALINGVIAKSLLI
ncbi:MAG: hypothetical protein QXS81_05630 [Candidatus Micrarchaeaceae archaeon]